MRIRRIAANDFKQLQSVDLVLPRVGRFLVQGKNEAGKSTLFEALYFGLFGKGLVGGKTEDLIGYAKEKARVEVWVEVGDKLLKVERTLRRGKTTEARLTIEKNDGTVLDSPTGTTAVNRKMTEYLRFDGDTLLNTCFVEQKKLDKLEGLDKGKREESLMKILNLERFTALDRELKLTTDDERELQHLRDRRDLARIRESLPSLEARRAAVEEALRLATAQTALREALAEHDGMTRRREAIADLERRQADLAEREQQVTRIRDMGQLIKDLMGKLDLAARERQEVASAAQKMAQANAARAALPGVVARAATLRRLARRLERLDRVARRGEAAQAEALGLERDAEDARARQAERDTLAARVAEVETGVRDAELAARQAEAAAKAWHARAALADWRDAYLAASAPERAQAELAEREAARQGLHTEFETAVSKFAANPPAASGWLTAVKDLLTRLADLFRRVDEVARRVGYLEGSRETLAQRAKADQKRLATAEARLREQGLTTPADDEAATARLTQLDTQVAGRELAALQDAARETADRLSRLRGQRDEMAQRVADLTRRLAGQDAEAVARAARRARGQVDKAQAILSRRQPSALADLGRLGLTRAELAPASRDADVEAGLLRKQVDELAGLERERVAREGRLAALEREAADLHARVVDVALPLPPLQPSLVASDLEPTRQELLRQFNQLGGSRVSEQRQAVGEELGGEREAQRQAEQRLARNTQLAREALRAVALADLLPDTEVETLRMAHERLAEYSLDAQALDQERRALDVEIGVLRDRRDVLEAKLAYGDVDLDLAACEGEVAALERDHAVRERARDMLKRARSRIIEKVMPQTMEYMRLILPQLTSGRYMDAQLSDDFKILVWDERAGDSGEMKGKDIFSGGCRDQMSLALRLSFALATLPSERGGAPAFIFLDEPLGAFDDERADALLDLLTYGEIGRAFDQIFLISHVRVNESAFHHRIRMEGGRVVDHDLPDETRGQPLAQAELMLEG